MIHSSCIHFFVFVLRNENSADRAWWAFGASDATLVQKLYSKRISIIKIKLRCFAVEMWQSKQSLAVRGDKSGQSNGRLSSNMMIILRNVTVFVTARRRSLNVLFVYQRFYAFLDHRYIRRKCVLRLCDNLRKKRNEKLKFVKSRQWRTNLLNECIVFKYFSRFHDANDGRLQIQFAILVDSAHCVLHFLGCFALQRGRYFEFRSFIRII